MTASGDDDRALERALYHEVPGEVVPGQTPRDATLETAAALSNLVPGLGGVVSQILSGMANDRKWERLNTFLRDVSADVQGLSAESQKYVSTEDFRDLLESTLRKVADERSAEKRDAYRRILLGAIKDPGQPYDEKIQLLTTLESLQPTHIRVLKAVLEPPATPGGSIGSEKATLRRRLPDLDDDALEEMVAHLNALRLTELSLSGMMTAEGAEDLRNRPLE